jgi:hypothetical protein
VATLSGAAANAGMKWLSLGLPIRLVVLSTMGLWLANYYFSTITGKIVIGNGRLEIECVHTTATIPLETIESVSLRCIPNTMSGGYQSIHISRASSTLGRTYRYNGATLQSQQLLADALTRHGVKVEVKNRAL